MKCVFAINGKFLGRAINGQIRVAIEIIKELDKIVEKGQYEIVAPNSNYNIEGLKNINVIRIGGGNIHVWEQTWFFIYIIRHKRVVINFLNTHPLFRPDICYVHDVIYKAIPSLNKSKYSFFQKYYTLLMIYTSIKLGKRIITVSEFSKKEIIKYYKVKSERIDVVPNGWEHIERIENDAFAVKKYGLKENEYYLSASGLTPQKNFKWIINNAKNNKNEIYVIVGKKEGTTKLDDFGISENVHFLGKVEDGELKSLMKSCKGFIHPAIYEGFGLTPLEAIASGANSIYLSKIPCLEEIYSEVAAFFDPFIADIDLEGIKRHISETNKNKLLSNYSWKSAAAKIKRIAENDNKIC